MQINHHAVTRVGGLLAASLWLSPALASDLTVTATTGQVTLTEHGRSVPPSVGAKFSLPVEIHTGPDGTVDVQQLGSSLHVGPSSTIALPESASHADSVDKIKQSAGYVLYNIKSRKDHPLSVETPYLVSVVKGTVFTIAVEEHAATVALMEGSLDISAPGVAEHVLLKPNQSIHHADGEPRLSVRSSASASVMPRSGLHADAPLTLPGAMQSSQMALVARDLADAGAAVTAGHAIAARQVSQSGAPGGSGTNSPPAGSGSQGTPNGGGNASSGAPGGSGVSTSPGSGGATSTAATGSTNSGGSSGTNSSPGGNSAGSGGSTSTGTSGGGVKSGSSGTGSTPGGSTNTGGSVTLPTSGSDNSNSGTCNGKNSGTGGGNCYGHQPGHGGKQ
jgi:hypothetical protein